MTTHDILKVAVLLPEAQRVQLIEALLASLDQTPSEGESAASDWRRIAAQRAAELDSGKVTAVSWDDVRQEAEQRIHDRTSN